MPMEDTLIAMFKSRFTEIERRLRSIEVRLAGSMEEPEASSIEEIRHFMCALRDVTKTRKEGV